MYLQDQLKMTLTNNFNQELYNTKQHIHDSISPYSTFMNQQLTHCNETKQQLESYKTEIYQLRSKLKSFLL